MGKGRILLQLLGFLGVVGMSTSCTPKRCYDVCANGMVRCAGAAIERCVFSPVQGCHNWSQSPCPAGQVCNAVSYQCTPRGAQSCLNKQHSRRCVGNAIHWFDDCGQQGDRIQLCQGTSQCLNGQCSQTGTCQNLCSEGQTSCTREGWLLRCVRNPQNQCMQWGAPEACPNQGRCVGTSCNGSDPCQSTCPEGSLRCQGSSVQPCLRQANGCSAWGNAIPCAAGQTCQAGQCVTGNPPPPQCPGSCSQDSQCQIAACGTRTQCLNGACQTPQQQPQCPGSCSQDSQCQIAACGARSQCRSGTCQTPQQQPQCPGSCSQDSQCQIAACGTRTSCVNGACAVPVCPSSCSSSSQCNVPACGNKKSCEQGKCSEGAQLTAAEKDLLDALNRARKKAGVGPVVAEKRLMCAARKHAKDVGSTGSCGHEGTDGSWPWDRAKACGYPQPKWTVNEIAAGPGFRDGDDAVRGWRASSGHWAGLIHNQAKQVGVAVYKSCYIALFDCCVKGSD